MCLRAKDVTVVLEGNETCILYQTQLFLEFYAFKVNKTKGISAIELIQHSIFQNCYRVYTVSAPLHIKTLSLV